MEKGSPERPLSGEILEEDIESNLADLCRACRVTAERIYELVGEGVIEPIGRGPARSRLRGTRVRRVLRVQRLEQGLGVNVDGAAIDLLEELRRLGAQSSRLEG